MLAGDALQALAYEILAKDDHEELTPEHRIEMLSLLTEASGAHGMAGGQAVDLASVGKQLTLEQLEHMHQLKTGALIRAAVAMGATLAGASRQQLAALDRYGEAIGLSFQVQDDILDIEGNTETLGKPQGSDIDADKPTYPAIVGMDEAKQMMMNLHQEALDSLEPFGEKAAMLRGLAEYIVTREN